MKKIAIILFIILLNFSALSARIQFGVVLLSHSGYAGNGDYNDATQSMVDSIIYSGGGMGWQPSRDQYMIEEGTANSAFGGGLEFRIKLQEDLIFGFGFGSISLPLGETRVEPIQMQMEDDPMAPEPGTPLSSLYRNMEGSASSMTLTEYYVLPIGNILEIYLGIGGEYCKAKINYTQETYMGGGQDISMSTEGEFDGSGLGFHTKLLFEFKATEKFRLLTGLMGKYLRISGLQGTEKTITHTPMGDDEEVTEGTIYSYEWGYGGGDGNKMWGVYSSKSEIGRDLHDVEEAYIDLSGIYFCFGVGYYF